MARKKKFNWGNFPVKLLKAILYSDKTSKRPPFDSDDADMLAPYMPYPNDYFFKYYREEIEDNFLCEVGRLTSVTRALEEMNYGDFHVGDPAKMMATLKKATLTPAVINAIEAEFLSIGTDDDFKFKTKFPKPATIDLQKSSGDEANVSLRTYQERAVLDMRKHFVDENKRAGILQMPTGSGKTLTAVYFLLTEMTARGYQIIWLAHRSMLIEQAANVFYKFAPLVKKNTDFTPPKKFNMICVSSDHCNSSMINRKDNLVVSMVPSLYYNKRRLRSVLQDKVIIVVDEAHHTVAPTYRTIIETIRKFRPDAKLLGLTATPIRGTEKETKTLWKIYESDKPVFELTMNQLISSGTLAKPIPKTIETNVDIETIIDEKEIAHIQRMHEMPESLINKIARTNVRNDLIVDEYVRHADKYGKTIIFALNGIHCMALDEALRARGIKSGFVYTLNKDNASTIERFRDNNHPDHIDVLININMLTEGSDIPDIQTVFLTRPTSSDVLLMQMVGRGMRGVDAGGTETVNIVDFCDKWSDITRWFNPKLLFPDDGGVIDPIEKPTYERVEYTLWPWDLIRAVMRGITYKGAQVVKTDTVLPSGWFNITDAEGNDEQILIFDNQLDGYKKLFEDVKYIADNLNDNNFDARQLLLAYFSNLGVMPLEDDLRDIVTFFRNENTFPEIQTFDERDKIDPYKVANGLKNKTQTFMATLNQIKNIYGEHREMIDNLYGGYEIYQDKVVNFMQYPNGVAPLGTVIEEAEKEFYPLSPQPIPDSLDKLLDEVVREQIANLGSNFVRPSVYWTDKAYRSYFATYNYRETREKDFIMVNRILNSASVPREVLKFLLYHECLHQRSAKHGVEFRELEARYPNFHDCENFLDRTFPDFVSDAAR
ncbi:MAG: DEAD/DEAH box helicase family protein [Selenomonadaceae bacterium]|nr:DEAD/DEAH box helicase family protein [Selenomonadaceae bacterium]